MAEKGDRLLMRYEDYLEEMTSGPGAALVKHNLDNGGVKKELTSSYEPV